MSASTHGTPASGYGTDLIRLICFEHIYGYTFPCTHQQGATRMTSTHPAGGATCWPNDVDADRHTIYRWCCIPPGPWVQGILSQPRESTGVTCALSGLGLPTELGCDGSQASICIQLGGGGGLKIYILDRSLDVVWAWRGSRSDLNFKHVNSVCSNTSGI